MALFHARRINLAFAVLAAFGLVAGIAIAAPALDAPNVVPISDTLVTSGQPTAAALAGLASQVFGAVINLAPLTAPDAVRDEPDIVQKHRPFEKYAVTISCARFVCTAVAVIPKWPLTRSRGLTVRSNRPPTGCANGRRLNSSRGRR